MNRLIALMFFGGMSLQLLADDSIRDPIQDYTSQPNAPQAPQIMVNGIEEVGAEMNGQKVIFISVPGYVGSYPGNIWTAYVQKDNRYTRLETTAEGHPIIFDDESFFAGTIPELSANGLMSFMLDKTGQGTIGDVWLYQLVADKITGKKVKTMNLRNSNDEGFITKYGVSSQAHLTQMSIFQLKAAGYTMSPRAEQAEETSDANPGHATTFPPSVPTPPAASAPVPVAEAVDTSIPVWVYGIVFLSVVLIGGGFFFLSSKK